MKFDRFEHIIAWQKNLLCWYIKVSKVAKILGSGIKSGEHQFRE